MSAAHCELTYPITMRLYGLYGWGSDRIQRFLKDTLQLDVDDRTIRHWIHGDRSPYGKINKMGTSDPVNRAYVLGALCGDASLYPHGVELGVNDKDFAAMFWYKAFRAYGVMPHFGSCDNHGKQRHTVEINSILVKRDIDQRGDFTTEHWRVPLEVWEALTMIDNFLRGWFDSEGKVGVHHVAGCSSNMDGLIGIGELLKELGVESTIRRDHYHQYGKEKRWCYDLEIRGEENIKQFARHINFSIKRKRERLAGLLEGKHYAKYSDMPDNPRAPRLRRSIIREDVLRELSKGNPMNIPELTQSLGVKRESARWVLKSLIEKGKVQRIGENPYRAKYAALVPVAPPTERGFFEAQEKKKKSD